MCLSMSGRVAQVRGAMAEVEIAGHTVWYHALACPEVQVGDQVLTYANMIIEVISEEEALRIQQLLREMDMALEQEVPDDAGDCAPVKAEMRET